MTQQATITAQYINPPKGKGPASVKDTQGVYWKVWTTGKNPIPLETFREGGTYLVGYKTEQYNGKDQYTITAAQDVTGGQLMTPTVPAPGIPVQPHPTNGRVMLPRTGPAVDHSRDEQIFVCGVVNNGIGAGKIDPFSAADIAGVAQAASAAFKAWKNKAELNDDIPRL